MSGAVEGPSVRFLQLQPSEQSLKAEIIYALCAQLYAAGKITLIRVSPEHADWLDRALWEIEPESFLPHVLLPSELALPPVLLTTNDCRIQGVNVLILASPPQELEWMRQFPQVIDFVELAVPERQALSRERFRFWRRLGVSPIFDKEFAASFRPDESGGESPPLSSD